MTDMKNWRKTMYPNRNLFEKYITRDEIELIH